MLFNCRYTKPEEAIDLMRKLKDLFDPHHIMNPYKFLPHGAGTQPMAQPTSDRQNAALESV